MPGEKDTQSNTSSDLSIGDEENRIEYIAGLHLSGEQYTLLKWDVQYFASDGIDHRTLKRLLQDRFGEDGFGLTLVGAGTYQLWGPEELSQADLDRCKDKPPQNSTH